MQLFYNPDINEEFNDVTFSKEESRHISKVLRKQEGDILKITNGKGYFFDVQLLSVDPKHTIANILNSERISPPGYRLHLAVAPTKLNDRYEWFLEKATEIGVEEITPIICDRSERKVVKLERYEKIVQSAMKQSLKAFLPKLNAPVFFKDFMKQDNHKEELKCIAHCEELDKQLLKNVVDIGNSVLILIGPEGDFSLEEISLAEQKGFIPVSLGNSRLRTETAAIVACQSVAFINETD